MKSERLLRYASTLCLLGCFMVLSCQQGIEGLVEKQSSQEVSVKGDLLKFNTLVDYEKIVKDSARLASLSNLEGFNAASVALQGARTAAKEPVPNATLAKVLNQDNMMQVGKWIVKLQFKERKVTAIDEKNMGKLLSALKDNKQADGIQTFSFDDDVLYALDNEDAASKNARPAFLCCCGIDGTQPEATQNYPHVGGNTAYPMTAYNTYEGYGVYFEASTRIVYKTYPLSLTPDPPVGTISLRYAWEQKCSNPEYKEEPFNSYQYLMGPDPNNNLQFVYKRLIYASGKGLRYLLLESQYQMPFLYLNPGQIYQDRR